MVFCCAVVCRSVLASDALINCDAHAGACSQSLGNITVTMEISPRPVKAMRELIFKVSTSGQSPSENPYLNLGMPGMKMGPNRVLLENNGQGIYQGRGVIVRCPSGRTIWFANITIPDAGEVKFIFDVIY